ncbi:MAG: hypothetical protein NWQ82_02375 [Solirubrobacteraceae bacterium]|nr:hypothetical protein [Solirubrobacteraceae bacterium]
MLKSRRSLSLLPLVVMAAAFGPVSVAGAATPASDPVPKNSPRDFSMELTARSAKWAKQAGSERLYTLTLQGVSKSAKVRSVSKSGMVSDARMPFRGLPPYWDVYGERSGQFTDGGESAQAPLAVIAVHGIDGVVLVQLPELQRSSAGKLVFTARLLADTDLARYEVRKIGGRYFLDDDLENLTAVKVPRNRSDVHVVLDFPRKRELPPAEPPAEPAAATASLTARSAARSHNEGVNPGVCDGNRSSYLHFCFTGDMAITDPRPDPANGGIKNQQCPVRLASTIRNPHAMNSPGVSIVGAGRPSYFYYHDVGIVGMSFWGSDMAGAGWSCSTVAGGTQGDPLMAVIWGPAPNFCANHSRRCSGYRWGNTFGISSNWVTWYTVSRCSAFLASWSASGRCW